jgi:hypothetical protein
MHVNINNLLGLAGVALTVLVGIALYVYLVFFNHNPNEEVQLTVISTQFQQYQGSADVYRSRLLDYAGMCDDIGLPPNVACQANDTTYRISQVLSDGTYYCMDQVGFKGVVTSVPRGLACPQE